MKAKESSGNRRRREARIGEGTINISTVESNIKVSSAAGAT